MCPWLDGASENAVLPYRHLGHKARGVRDPHRTRSSMLDVLGRDYIRGPRQGPGGTSVVIFVHALRNALIPVSKATLGTTFGSPAPARSSLSRSSQSPASSVCRLRPSICAITPRSRPLLSGRCHIVSMNLLVDIMYSLIGPRDQIQLSSEAGDVDWVAPTSGLRPMVRRRSASQGIPS